MGLMLANSATGAWAQTAQPIIGSTAGAIQSDDAIDQELAEQISHAWLAGKDVSGAVAFQVKGENALTQGNPQQLEALFRGCAPRTEGPSAQSGGSTIQLRLLTRRTGLT